MESVSKYGGDGDKSKPCIIRIFLQTLVAANRGFHYIGDWTQCHLKLDWNFQLQHSTFTLIKVGDYILELADMYNIRIQGFDGET